MGNLENLHNTDSHHGHSHSFGGHHHHHQISRKASKKALWGALLILAVFFFVEITGGILAGSLALLSDAAHLLTDVAAVGLAIFAQWFATRPSSARQSYGYRRVEIFAALFNGLTLWVVAVLISIEAVERLINPSQVEAVIMLVVAAAGCVAQTGAAVVLAKASGESLNVRGAYIHAMTDAVQSLGVVAASLIIMFTGFVIVDPLMSIAISLLIIWSGGKIVFEAVHVLLEGTPSEIDLFELARSMQDIEGVEKITDLHAWSLTSGYNALSAHVVGTAVLDAAGREELAECIARKLRRDFCVHHVTLQVEKACTMEGEGACSDWLKK